MQPNPNRLGLGLRPPMPSYGQGPSISALAQQPQMLHPPHPAFLPPQTQRQTSLFIGSISGGITDSFLNRLLGACGSVKSFKRLITPANKPQGFGFAEFEDPDSALRALTLLNGVELPALEDGCANKKLLVKADEKTRVFLDAYSSQRMKTEVLEAQEKESKANVDELLADIVRVSQDATNSGLLDKEKYVIPPHLHDLQEADLPETQRGLVISEIAQFRERAAKREREKVREVKESIPAVVGMVAAGQSIGSGTSVPSGPKAREWGRGPKGGHGPDGPGKGGYGPGAQGYGKPVAFIKAEGPAGSYDDKQKAVKSDEQLEEDRKEGRRRDEEASFRDRERRYEPRERARIQAIERTIARDRAMREAEERDRVEIKSRLDVWDDDESDELFYVDRQRWRGTRARRLAAEEAADAESRAFEEREAENLRRESEAFLARQMDEMQALAEEQRKAGLLLDDGAPVKLNVSLASVAAEEHPADSGVVLGLGEEEEDGIVKRKVPLVKLDFSATEGEKAKENLEKIKESIPKQKEILFKSKVRWDGLSDPVIDRKFEPLVKRLMTKYLGELEDDDLVMFVLEHLKDHKSASKLVEGVEPVLEEEAVEFTIDVWRQIIFESIAYGEGLNTGRMYVD